MEKRLYHSSLEEPDMEDTSVPVPQGQKQMRQSALRRSQLVNGTQQKVVRLGT